MSSCAPPHLARSHSSEFETSGHRRGHASSRCKRDDVGGEWACNAKVYATDHAGTDVLICPVERGSTGFCRPREMAEFRSAGQMRTSAPTWFVKPFHSRQPFKSS